MRRAEVYQQGTLAGELAELDRDRWRFTYASDYRGPPVSLALRVRSMPYEFEQFPPLFEGLLPEGLPLEALLRQHKIDRRDLFKQLVTVGEDVVGSLTIREVR